MSRGGLLTENLFICLMEVIFHECRCHFRYNIHSREIYQSRKLQFNLESDVDIAIFIEAHGFHFIFLTLHEYNKVIFLDHMFLDNT